MPSILLFGDAEHIPPFVRAASEGYDLYVVGDALFRVTAADEELLFTKVEEEPGPLDVIIDLEYERETLLQRVDVFGRVPPYPKLYIVNTLTITATEIAARLGGEVPTIGISYVPDLFATSALVEAAPALQTGRDAAERGIGFLRGLLSREVEQVTDRIGLVSARTLAMVINEAAFALMEGVADAEDIDVAMKLGTNYPEGPLRWADRMGPEVVVAILEALHAEYGEERYRPCVLLKQMARARRGFYEPVDESAAL